MASFTDNLQALTSFTPYVAQVPTEAMVQVGTQKQAQYNDGIQKIQSNIDQVAGMDVIRDVDKQYLQSKLNQLGGDLKKVAAGDFSNYQLVNSVGGMISSVAKDKNVQNAVSSTTRYRKGLADMDTAIKDGKSSPSNEWDFQTQANGWLNGDIGASFNGRYNPYTNYKKNAIEVIKALTKSEDIRDDAFTVDSKGNLVIADSTVRKRLAGIQPEQIQTALMATLSPADFKQMEIDGRYNYSNVSPEQLSKNITSSYNDKIGFYNEQKKVLQNAKSSTTSNVERAKLDDQISSLDKTIDSISKNHNSMLEAISSGNAEGVKAQLQTSNFIDNFSKAFSFTETSSTFVGKTPQEMNMWRADKEQDWLKFITNLGWDKEKFALSYTQKNRELDLKKQELSGYGGLPQGIDQKDVPKYTLDKVIADTTMGMESLAKSDAEFIGNKDSQWFDAQRAAWEKSPSAVDPKIKDYFERTEPLRRNVASNQIMVQDIQKKAEAQYGTIDQYIPKDAQPVEILDSSSGQYITYTPQDIVRYNQERSKYIKLEGGSKDPDYRKMPKAVFDLEKAKRELSPKQYNLFEIESNKSGDKGVKDLLRDYESKVNVPYRERLKEIRDFTAAEVTSRITAMQGMNYGIPTATEAQKSSMGTALTQFADLAASQKDGLANSPDFDIKVARALAVDNSTNYTMTVVEPTEYSDAIYKITAAGKAGETQFYVTPEQKASMFPGMFEAAPEVAEFRPYQAQIRKMGGKTTAFGGGDSNHNNAYLSKVDFPSVQDYGVKANVEQPSPGKYTIRLSLYDPLTQKWYDDIAYPKQSLVREDQVMPFIKQLNDTAIFEIINDRTPGPNELKQVKLASKKPL